MGKRVSKVKSVPEWVELGRQATVIYDILATPFEVDCECKTCELIRENEEFLANIFSGPKPPGRRR